jgi:hypothetical protein
MSSVTYDQGTKGQIHARSMKWNSEGLSYEYLLQ